MVTADDMQGRGLATLIVTELLAWAWAARRAHAYLQVDDDNAPALAVYRKFGFATPTRTTTARGRTNADEPKSTVRTTQLATSWARRLRARGWLCATAESCTGGLVAGAITAIAGSSDWFDRGFVTYSNDAKIAMLAVPPATLAVHGAVSEPTARAMADRRARAKPRRRRGRASPASRGPGGAVPGKPVGTVCFAWAARDGEPRVETRHLAGDRAAVREASVEHRAPAG